MKTMDDLSIKLEDLDQEYRSYAMELLALLPEYYEGLDIFEDEQNICFHWSKLSIYCDIRLSGLWLSKYRIDKIVYDNGMFTPITTYTDDIHEAKRVITNLMGPPTN